MFKSFGLTGYLFAAILCLSFFQGSARAGDPVPALVTAAKAGDAATIANLLGKGADPNSHDADGLTALNWAAYNGHLSAVQALVGHHADVNSHGNKSQWTPLMNSAAEGHIDVVSFLIAHGADVNARSADGYSALYFAVIKKETKTVAFLKSHGAKAVTVGLLNPQAQALCNSAGKAGFDLANLAWRKSANGPTQYFCQGVKHDFPGGAGNVFMFTYEVDEDSSGAKVVWITADIYDDDLRKDALNTTLQPLLTAVFSAGGKGPVPDDLAGKVASISEFHSDTALGSVTAHYQPGNAASPYNGAKYEIQIQLAQ